MRPSEYFKEGYTCGEAMIKAYNEEHNTDLPVSIGSSMGTGFTVGSVCGSVGAAAAIIGILKGRENNDVPNEARKHTRQLMLDVRDKFGTEICKSLKQNNVSCFDIIDFTYDSLNKIIS